MWRLDREWQLLLFNNKGFFLLKKKKKKVAANKANKFQRDLKRNLFI